ncbi:pyridoxal phosphate-dependent transferase [Xylariales sp. PMI_506]|nr:pyridoxal phosphate-dependent transferase [Xylariales sp. PMI_506]
MENPSRSKNNDPINLMVGWPSKSLLPAHELATASQAVLSNPEAYPSALLYGPDYGEDSIRQQIASWLNTKYRTGAPAAIPPERVIITNGASGTLAAILQCFADPVHTKRIFIIEPTYFLACQTFVDAGYGSKLSAIPAGSEGVDIQVLRAQLEKIENSVEVIPKDQLSDALAKPASGVSRKIYSYIMYLVPTLSNPSGQTMPLQLREDLVKLARQFDILLVSDDVYDFLSWPEDETCSSQYLELPPRLVDLDRKMEGTSEFGNAVSNGSFSKLVAPGLRTGWCEAPPKFIGGLSSQGPTRSGGCQSQYTSFLVDHLLRSGALEHHLHSILIPELRRRRAVMLDAIHSYLQPLGFTISPGISYNIATRKLDSGEEATSELAGGYFLYLDYPPCLDCASVNRLMETLRNRYQVKLAPGDIFAVQSVVKDSGSVNASFRRGSRLCWAWHEEEALVEGVRRISEAFRELFPQLT